MTTYPDYDAARLAANAIRKAGDYEVFASPLLNLDGPGFIVARSLEEMNAEPVEPAAYGVSECTPAVAAAAVGYPVQRGFLAPLSLPSGDLERVRLALSREAGAYYQYHTMRGGTLLVLPSAVPSGRRAA